MSARRKATPPESRIEYRWPVDRESGFENATLIYDSEGRLSGIDYRTSQARPSVPLTPPPPAR